MRKRGTEIIIYEGTIRIFQIILVIHCMSIFSITCICLVIQLYGKTKNMKTSTTEFNIHKLKTLDEQLSR